MKITIFGANGKVGRLVVAEALKQGYQVKAFVHNRNSFEENENLEIVKGDIYNKADVEKALTGSEAVISALGSWGTKNKDVLTSGMVNIIPAMKLKGIRRIISLTGADARAQGDTKSKIHKVSYFMIKLIGKKVILDGENHIKLLASSKLEWTVLRSPVMSNFFSENYKLTAKRPFPWVLINRKAVAKAIVDQISETNNIGKSPFMS